MLELEPKEPRFFFFFFFLVRAKILLACKLFSHSRDHFFFILVEFGNYREGKLDFFFVFGSRPRSFLDAGYFHIHTIIGFFKMVPFKFGSSIVILLFTCYNQFFQFKFTCYNQFTYYLPVLQRFFVQITDRNLL